MRDCGEGLRDKVPAILFRPIPVFEIFPMLLFDSHTHLCDRAFIGEVDAAVERALRAGVETLVDVGYDRETIERSAEISRNHSNVFSAFGFHPHEAGKISPNDIDWLKMQLANPRCIAFGEIGLDFVKNYSDRDSQFSLFEKMMALARILGKPIIFHSRGAEAEVLARACALGVKKAVFHCYTGPEDVAVKIVEAGYYLSFAGYLTFPKGWPAWMGKIPLERIMIETDAPYLTPVPFRGKRNEPAFVEYTCKRLALGLGQPADEIARVTTENAKRFFGLT